MIRPALRMGSILVIGAVTTLTALSPAEAQTAQTTTGPGSATGTAGSTRVRVTSARTARRINGRLYFHSRAVRRTYRVEVRSPGLHVRNFTNAAQARAFYNRLGQLH